MKLLRELIFLIDKLDYLNKEKNKLVDRIKTPYYYQVEENSRVLYEINDTEKN